MCLTTFLFSKIIVIALRVRGVGEGTPPPTQHRKPAQPLDGPPSVFSPDSSSF